MPDPVTGIIVGTAAVGGYIASESQNKATKAQEKASKRELAFQKEQYQRYLNVYGDMEENIGDFYSNLTPEYITTQGLEQQQQQHQTAISRIKEEFAQSDVTAGAQADILARSELESARDRAEVRVDAPLKAIEQKQSFLALGKGTPTGYGESLREATRTAGRGHQAEADLWTGAATTAAQIGGTYAARSLREPVRVQPAVDIPVPFVEGGN